MLQSQINGEATTSVIRPLVHESQSQRLAGKTAVAVGGGNENQRCLWTEAARLGMKLVLVDSDPDHAARHDVDTFLHVDMTDHTQDVQHANAIVRLLRQRLPDRQVDGCLTICEDFVPLAAHVGQALGLRHVMSVEAALNAKSKARTHTVLGQQKGKSPHDLSPAVYASPVVRITTVQEVAKAFEKISLPAVIKPEFGSHSFGVKHVHTIQEAEEHMVLMQKTLRSEADMSGIGLGHGRSMIVMPRLLGSEHVVDLVLYEDEIIAVFLMDSGPTRLPLCLETTMLTPSLLSKEQQNQLIQAAASCCRGVGLRTGVASVEMIMTSCGPRLLEINARMNKFYARDWIRLIYNMDLFHLALMCACGIRPELPGCISLEENPKDRCNETVAGVIKEDAEAPGKEFVMGTALYRSRHAHALATTATPSRLRRLDKEGRIIFSEYKAGKAATANPFEMIYGSLAVKTSCPYEAKSKLVSICTELGLETEKSLLEISSKLM